MGDARRGEARQGKPILSRDLRSRKDCKRDRKDLMITITAFFIINSSLVLSVTIFYDYGLLFITTLFFSLDASHANA